MHYEPMDKASFAQVFENELLKRGLFNLYFCNGEPCAMVTAIFGNGRCSHIATIASFTVLPTFRGQGIGQEVITATVDTLVDQEFVRIELFAEADNPKAINLYKKCGFETEEK